MQNAALENLLTRRAVRSYKTDPVPDDVLNRVIEAGLYAPSGMGRESPVILAVTNKEVRDELSRLNAAVMHLEGDPFYGAPVVLVVLASPELAGTYLEDGALVMGNLLNAAHAEGLGSCWIHRAKQVFETPEGKAILEKAGVPAGYVGIGNCILGYAAEPEPAAKPRRNGRVFRLA